MSDKIQKQVWHLVHSSADGWIPSFDYPQPWRTRKAARKALKAIDLPKRLIYKLVCYEVKP